MSKLLRSSTFLLGVLACAVQAVGPALGVVIPPELLATFLGAYGVKEAGRYVASARSQP